MHRDSLAMEHYRMHVMEQWPDSPTKTASLATVRATIESLERTKPAGATPFTCAECLSARPRPNLVVLPAPSLRPTQRRAA